MIPGFTKQRSYHVALTLPQVGLAGNETNRSAASLGAAATAAAAEAQRCDGRWGRGGRGRESEMVPSQYLCHLPSGKHTKNYGKSPFLMGKSIMKMVIFNSYVKLPEGNVIYI